ncbi:MAG: hypothetical protein NC078_05665 [Ruminococcus sp.]|nr:hypothetical protein [Ruminococcus sp.]
MKLKKLLAGITAAALAAGLVAVTPALTSADNDGSSKAAGSATLGTSDTSNVTAYQGYELSANKVSVTASADDDLAGVKAAVTAEIQKLGITLKKSSGANDKVITALGSYITNINTDSVKLENGEYTVTASVNVSSLLGQNEIYYPTGITLGTSNDSINAAGSIAVTITVTVSGLEDDDNKDDDNKDDDNKDDDNKDDDNKDDDNKDDNVTVDSIWEGSLAVTWEDGGRVIIEGERFADLENGDKLVISFVPGDGAQLQFNNGEWAVLEASKVLDGFTDAVVVVSGTSVTLVIDNENDLNALKKGGMIIQGQYCTVTKIELVKSIGGSEEPTPTPTPEPAPAPALPVGSLDSGYTPSVGDTPVSTALNSGNAVSGANAVDAASHAKSGDVIAVIMDGSTDEQTIIGKIAGKNNITVQLQYSGYTLSINSNDVSEDFNGKSLYTPVRFLSASEKAAFAGAKEIRQVGIRNMEGIEKATVSVNMRGGSKGLNATALKRTAPGKFRTVDTGKVADNRTFSFEITSGGNYVVCAGDIDED